MELTELHDEICRAFSGTERELREMLEVVEKDISVFPFNKYEHMICQSLGAGRLTLSSYLDIRGEYLSQNPHLWVFEISAPRGFGEGFAHTYLEAKCSGLKRASKRLDPAYSGQYDLWLDGVRIEVKASRAVDAESDAPLYVKALSRQTHRPFLMNFQQLKPQHCDVFIWVAVFRDEIAIWVMSASEVRLHAQYSGGQHRGNLGNEGQLHIRESNIGTLKSYELGAADLGAAIKAAACRNVGTA